MKTPVLAVVSLLAGSLGMKALADVQYEEVPVLESIPQIRIVEISTPREQCREQEVLVEQGHQDGLSNTPVLVSTIIGGAIGNAVGHGKSNKRVGAVVGAMLGHSIGRDIIRDRSDQYSREYQVVERCETVYESRTEERIVGYRVTYDYHGQEQTIQTDRDPGDTIRVRVSVEPVL